MNFGATYGIIAAYVKSASSTIATAGILRLAKGDLIDWRNNANSGNNALGVDTSDRLTWNTVPLVTGTAGVAPVASGGTGLATLTAHGVLVGEGTSNVALVGPSATSGQALISQGSSADPAYGAVALDGGSSIVSGTLPVGNGGTGQTSLTAHGVVVGAGSGGVTVTSAGTSGKPLVSGGASADPSFATLGVSGGGTGDASLTAYAVMCGGTTSTGAVQSIASVGSSGQVLTSNGAGALPTFQNASQVPVRTRQVFTSGSAQTYTTPANCRQLFIRMVGGGGGGAAESTNAGADGNDTIFNAIHAASGKGGSVYSGNGGAGGAGGTGGTGSASLRMSGTSGGSGIYNTTGGQGGSSVFGGAGQYNVTGAGPNAAANSGSGGGGGVVAATGAGGAGGAGEYVELIINSPAATYTYTVGAGGNGGAAGGSAGGNGAAGIIIVDEWY